MGDNISNGANKKLIGQSFLHAAGVAVYVAIVALIMNYGQNWFSASNNVLTATAVLLLLCLSAAIVGSLIFGRPAYLIVTGQKSEGIRLLFWTLGFLVILVVIVLVTLALLY